MPNLLVRCAALLSLGAGLAACATSANRAETAAGDASAARCALRPQDSTFALLGPVFRDCQVQTKALFLTTDIRPDFRPSGGAADRVGHLLDPDASGCRSRRYAALFPHRDQASAAVDAQVLTDASRAAAQDVTSTNVTPS